MLAEKVILTGNMLDGFIEVKMKYNMIRYARPCYNSITMSKFGPKWVEKYGNKYWGFVTFDQGRPEDLVLLGVVPMDGKEVPDEGFEDKHYIYSEKFRIFMDDDANVFSIDTLENGGVIALGDKTATEYAVLGNVLMTILEELVDALKAAKTNTPIGPQPFMPGTQVKLTTIKNKLDTILSTKVKLQ